MDETTLKLTTALREKNDEEVQSTAIAKFDEL